MSELPETRSGPPELAPDEHWLVQLPANRTQGKRAVAGTLHLSNRRLVFAPSAVEARLRGKPWSCAVSEIVAVGVEPGRRSLLELFSGGRDERLRVDLAGNQRALFVVDSPHEHAAAFREHLHVSETMAELPVARLIE